MHYDVGVIGLGYVGLTFATTLADIGFSVLGVEKRLHVVEMTNEGKSHFSESGLEEMLGYVISAGRFRAVEKQPKGTSCNIYVLTVGTPLAEDGQAHLGFIELATQEVAEHMQDDALVILRSTVKVGTARNVVAPILAQTGRRFQIAMCPERTLEGRAMYELRHLPQIVGADDAKTRERAAHFFYKLTHTVVQVSSLETAEVLKLVDNTFRDVQFGFANEVARVCDAYGINAMEVIGGGKLGYPRTNVALPGLVGGPCLEKDPHILFQSALERGINLDVTLAARTVNERQPRETVDFIAAEYNRRSAERDPIIGLLGMAFKGVPATDDLRGSMSLKVLAALRAKFPSAEIRLYDPVCSQEQLAEIGYETRVCATLSETLANADIAIIANNHPELGMARPTHLMTQLSPKGFIFDYWNHFWDLRPHETGTGYYAIGNIKKTP